MKGDHSLPTRSATTTTMGSDGTAVEEDYSAATALLVGRLEAWKHVCAYLEDYIVATEKAEKAHAKEYERAVKAISTPLTEERQFDQTTGGIITLFENLRLKTKDMADLHLETEKSLRKSVFPLLEDLHSEIKNEVKNLSKSASKDSKSVDKSRAATQAHIDLLRDCTNAFDTGEYKFDPVGDPYIVQRQLLYRLNKQISEENNNRDGLLAAQGSFQKFETHVIQTIQRVIASFVQVLTSQAERTKILYADMAHVAQRMPLDLEWNGFIRRNGSVLIDPSVPPHTMQTVDFPNRDHPATRALIEGVLERRSGHLVKRYKTGYYVVTPSKFLHELEDDDFARRELTPELSLYLPDCTVGTVSGPYFTVKGKDASKGKIGAALTTAHELEFKARDEAEARRWWDIIRQLATADDSVPTPSPTTAAPAANIPELAPSGAPAAQAGGLGTASAPPGYNAQQPLS